MVEPEIFIWTEWFILFHKLYYWLLTRYYTWILNDLTGNLEYLYDNTISPNSALIDKIKYSLFSFSMAAQQLEIFKNIYFSACSNSFQASKSGMLYSRKLQNKFCFEYLIYLHVYCFSSSVSNMQRKQPIWQKKRVAWSMSLQI